MEVPHTRATDIVWTGVSKTTPRNQHVICRGLRSHLRSGLQARTPSLIMVIIAVTSSSSGFSDRAGSSGCAVLSGLDIAVDT